MTEETTAPQAEASTSKTLLVGCSIVIWILAIFMIVTLNNIKDELTKLNMATQQLLTTTSTSLASFQVKDAQGNVVYEFAAKPIEVMENMPACSADAPASK